MGGEEEPRMDADGEERIDQKGAKGGEELTADGLVVADAVAEHGAGSKPYDKEPSGLDGEAAP